MAANDMVLENINVKLEGLASAFQNQLSFLETLVLTGEAGKIPG